MPASSLLTLLDDITMLLDDVAVMTKVAAKKTSGILGDDLALNAQQVTGVKADRELPVVWAVAKGSLVNKVILVPIALALSEFAPWSVTPLLMIGGGFLCYEGVEKVAHKLFHKKEEAAHHAELVRTLSDPHADVLALEKAKIKGAIRTDFILSAEIVAITLAAAEAAKTTFAVKAWSMTLIALIMTVGVYALVAGIVKLDDAGIHLSQAPGEGAGARFRRASGRGILRGAPWLMKALSVGGTAAMFLVGGGILVHGIAPVHHAVEGLATSPGGVLGTILETLANGGLGIVAGAVILAVVLGLKRVFRRKPAAS